MRSVRAEKWYACQRVEKSAADKAVWQPRQALLCLTTLFVFFYFYFALVRPRRTAFAEKKLIRLKCTTPARARLIRISP